MATRTGRLIVKSLGWQWGGGYEAKGEHQGRPYFERDNSHDSNPKHRIYYHPGQRRWIIGENFPEGGRFSYSTMSTADGDSPENASWPSDKVEEIKAWRGEDAAEDLDLFIDAEFPHNMASIGWVSSIGEVEWIPARSMRPGRWKLFDGIDPRDLLQGKIGNCWLIAALAALAEFPKEVERLFLRDGMKEGDGRYVVRLFDHNQGRNIEVTVDEYMPCHPRRWWDIEAKTCFADPNGNEVWCLVIEKAMAKVFGSYGELEGGTAATAFRALTGDEEPIVWVREGDTWKMCTLVPGTKSRFSYPSWGGEELSNDAFFKRLEEYDQQNFLMGASIENWGGENKRRDGLVEGHAYSLMQVEDIPEKMERGTDIRLLELRNPWGNEVEWNGAWSDGDRKWKQHPEVKAHLRPTFGDDGAFWMDWTDFSRIFTGVCVCRKPMREGESAMTHALASRDWRSFKPKPTQLKSPSHGRVDKRKAAVAKDLLASALNF